MPALALCPGHALVISLTGSALPKLFRSWPRLERVHLAMVRPDVRRGGLLSRLWSTGRGRHHLGGNPTQNNLGSGTNAGMIMMANVATRPYAGVDVDAFLFMARGGTSSHLSLRTVARNFMGRVQTSSVPILLAEELRTHTPGSDTPWTLPTKPKAIDQELAWPMGAGSSFLRVWLTRSRRRVGRRVLEMGEGNITSVSQNWFSDVNCKVCEEGFRPQVHATSRTVHAAAISLSLGTIQNDSLSFFLFERLVFSFVCQSIPSDSDSEDVASASDVESRRPKSSSSGMLVSSAEEM